MVFEFKSSGEIGLMAAFAQSIGAKAENGMLMLPPSLGKGYIKGFDLGPLIRMMLHQYELDEDLTFRRIAAPMEKDVITISFHHLLSPSNGEHNGPTFAAGRNKRLPSVQVTSAHMDFETFFPAHTPVHTIIIAVHLSLLNDLIHPKEENTLLRHIVSGQKPYLYEEIMSPEIQTVAAQIVSANIPEQLRHFYLKLKAEELVYLFFAELLKRENIADYPLNGADVKMMYAIRDRLIADLGVPPNLPELAAFAHISESKMKRLFKQIFGSSIYHYYQTLRMNEAAYLIKGQKLSVSETGYRLGFSNLSHFTRLFEKHVGQKPKKFSMGS